VIHDVAVIILILSPVAIPLGIRFLVLCWTPNVVYYLKRGAGDANPKAVGWAAYVGSSKDWPSRMGRHQDDRDADWAPWKRDVDWAISGPVLRTLTEGGARRAEMRRIRTLTYASRIGVCPPIENDTGTNLSRGPHPVRWLHLLVLRVEALPFPERALFEHPVTDPDAVSVESWPTPVVDLDGRTVVDVDDAEGDGTLSPNRPDTGPAPLDEPAVVSSDPVDPSPVAPDAPKVGAHELTVQPSHLVPLSHDCPAVSLSHCLTGPRRGPAAETPETLSHAVPPSHAETPTVGSGGPTVGAERATGDGRRVEADDAASPPRRSTGSGRPKGGQRKASGAADKRVARARQLHDRGLSLAEIVAEMADEGVTVSRSSVGRWVK
jgi:hypothetical protein